MRKKSYKTNPDIRKKDSINNIELVSVFKNIETSFLKLLKNTKKHEEKMKTIRQDRYKTFNQMVDDYIFNYKELE